MIRAQITVLMGAARVVYEQPVASVLLDPLARNPVLVEAVRPSDSAVIVMSFFRTFADGALSADLAARAIGKPRADAASVADAAIKGSGKVLQDQGGVGDAATKSAGKPVGDAAAAGDALSRTVAYTRSYADQAGATDDLNGILGADDDQTITFTKSLSRTALAADAFERAVSFQRAPTDQSAAGDLKSLLVSKPASDGSAAGDQAFKSFGAAKAETARAADALARTVAYSRELPQVYALDYFAEDYTSTDRALLSDALARSVAKSRSDEAGAADGGFVFYANYALDYFASDYCGSITTF